MLKDFSSSKFSKGFSKKIAQELLSQKEDENGHSQNDAANQKDDPVKKNGILALTSSLADEKSVQRNQNAVSKNEPLNDLSILTVQEVSGEETSEKVPLPDLWDIGFDQEFQRHSVNLLKAQARREARKEKRKLTAIKNDKRGRDRKDQQPGLTYLRENGHQDGHSQRASEPDLAESNIFSQTSYLKAMKAVKINVSLNYVPEERFEAEGDDESENVIARHQHVMQYRRLLEKEQTRTKKMKSPKEIKAMYDEEEFDLSLYVEYKPPNDVLDATSDVEEEEKEATEQLREAKEKTKDIFCLLPVLQSPRHIQVVDNDLALLSFHSKNYAHEPSVHMLSPESDDLPMTKANTGITVHNNKSTQLTALRSALPVNSGLHNALAVSSTRREIPIRPMTHEHDNDIPGARVVCSETRGQLGVIRAVYGPMKTAQSDKLPGVWANKPRSNLPIIASSMTKEESSDKKYGPRVLNESRCDPGVINGQLLVDPCKPDYNGISSQIKFDQTSSITTIVDSKTKYQELSPSEGIANMDWFTWITGERREEGMTIDTTKGLHPAGYEFEAASMISLDTESSSSAYIVDLKAVPDLGKDVYAVDMNASTAYPYTKQRVVPIHQSGATRTSKPITSTGVKLIESGRPLTSSYRAVNQDLNGRNYSNRRVHTAEAERPGTTPESYRKTDRPHMIGKNSFALSPNDRKWLS